MKGFKSFCLNTSNIIILFLALIAINFLASKFYLKWDLTHNNIYTLSKASKKIAKGVDDFVSIQYFFSDSNEDIPLAVKEYGIRVKDMLEEFASCSKFIDFKIINPAPDTEEEELAITYKLQSVPTEAGNFYMGAVIHYKGQRQTIAFFDPRNASFLEYEIAENLSKVTSNAKRRSLGILTSLPIFQKKEEWWFIKELEKSFNVKDLDFETEEISSDIGMLLVLHPKNISEKTEYAIEQYILNGGKAMIIVDPSCVSNAEPLKQAGVMQQNRPMPFPTFSSVDNIFKFLGIQYDKSLVVADPQNATQVQAPGSGVVRYPFWLFLTGKSLNKDMFFVNNLQSLFFLQSGFFENNGNYDYISLINTSSDSGYVESVKLGINQMDALKNYNKSNQKYSIAGIVRGRFKSIFGKKPKESLYRRPHVNKASKENNVILIADADFLNTNNSMRVLNFFGTRMMQPMNQNIVLVQNALEFLSGDTALISIRSKGSFHRPFDKILEIEREAQEKWLKVEEKLDEKIRRVQSQLSQIQRAKTQENEYALSSMQQDEINKFQLELVKAKKERREVRKKLREDIDRLGKWLTFLNMSVIPMIILGLGLYIYYRRTRGNTQIRK